MKQSINKPVVITSLGFKQGNTPYPRRMEFDGRSIEFVDSGLAFEVKKGSALTRILTMTDGIKQFRLRSDNRGGIWTLLDISA